MKAYNLKFYSLAVEFDCADFLIGIKSVPIVLQCEIWSITDKIDADGRDVAFRIGIIGKPQKQA